MNKVFFIFLFFILNAFGAELSFKAQVDREQIESDQSVTLKMSVESQSQEDVDSPSFDAPDFDVINQYQSQSMQSLYQNGQFETQFSKLFTFVLRPKKTGKFTIKQIELNAGGRKYSAEPISVEVIAGGAATPMPKSYGGGGSGLRGAAKDARGKTFMVRAEVDKNRIYKGEPVVISYYIYSKTQSFNAEAQKIPGLKNFLKEELDTSGLQGRVQYQIVNLDGVVYKKGLMLSYVAYPLKEGKVSIDQLTVKVNYYDAQSLMNEGDEEDPQDLFQQFFRQMTPRSALLQTDPLSIEVLPVPTDGRPTNYSGIVGQLEMTASLKSTQAKVGEPLTLNVQVRGSGNLSSLELPPLQLPPTAELYESHGEYKAGRGGLSEKNFEVLIIPRKEGVLTIPAVSLSYFDPKKAAFLSAETQAQQIQITAGGSSSATANSQVLPAPTASSSQFQSPEKDQELAQEWLNRASEVFKKIIPILLGIILLIVSFFLFRKLLKWIKIRTEIKGKTREKRQKTEKIWAEIRKKIELEKNQLSFSEVSQIYQKISDQILQTIDLKYAIGAKSYSREDLRTKLGEQGKIYEDSFWSDLSQLLEKCENIKYASYSGSMSENSARLELDETLNRAEKIAQLI